MDIYMITSKLILCFICTHLTWYRYPDLEAFIREEWEAGFLANWDANDLVTLMHTWRKADVSTVRHGGDFGKCLNEIQAKGLIMPCKTDLYFTVRCPRCHGIWLLDAVYSPKTAKSKFHT